MQPLHLIQTVKNINAKCNGFVTLFLQFLVCFIFLLLIPVKFANAAVFDNLNANLGGATTNIEQSGSSYWDRNFVFVFSSSTLQLELTDFSLRQYSPLYSSTITRTLKVTTDKGVWTTSTNSLLTTNSQGTTSTWTFSYPHPYATPGTDWKFELLELPTTTYQVFTKLTNATDTQQTILLQKEGSTTLVDYRSYYPYNYLKYRINDSGLGGVTLTTPYDTDYSFTTGTATGADFGYFGNMFRDVLYWFFKPNGYTLANNFATVKQAFSEKFPFSYLVSVITLVDATMAETSSTSVLFTYSPPSNYNSSTALGAWLNPSQPLIQIDSSSTAALTTNFPIITFFRTLIGYGLWVLLIFEILFGLRYLLR